MANSFYIVLFEFQIHDLVSDMGGNFGNCSKFKINNSVNQKYTSCLWKHKKSWFTFRSVLSNKNACGERLVTFIVRHVTGGPETDE